MGKKTIAKAVLGSIISAIFMMTIFAINLPAVDSDGKVLYEKSCKMCHGIDGKGNAKLAQGMKIKPGALDLTKQETKDKKDEALKIAITDGIGKMKGFKDKLKAEEIVPIVAHVRTLQK